MANVHVTDGRYDPGSGSFTVTIVISPGATNAIRDIYARLDGLADAVTRAARYKAVSKLDLFVEELRAARARYAAMRDSVVGPLDLSVHWRKPAQSLSLRPILRARSCPRTRASHRRKLRTWERT